ncbi:hypothetical protein FRC19_010705 [Serendipita sp. 401]|nr:hypothetical protein FRC19_010705 [Serendipita sp. 401]KAG9052070.1 hypothetical protein FS842_010542 [Serendipita sp. 407]
MRLSFVIVVLAMLAFNTTMAAPISVKDKANMEEYNVGRPPTALGLANQDIQEPQNHEGYLNLVRRELSITQHRTKAEEHLHMADISRQQAIHHHDLANQHGESDTSTEHTNTAISKVHEATYHEHLAQAHMSRANELEHPSDSAEHRKKAVESLKKASKELEKANRFNGQRQPQRQKEWEQLHSLSAAEHRSKVDEHNQEARRHDAWVDHYNGLIRAEGPDSPRNIEYKSRVEAHDHMYNHHVLSAQAHRNMVEAHEDPSNAETHLNDAKEALGLASDEHKLGVDLSKQLEQQRQR